MDMAGEDRLVNVFLTGIAQRLPHLHERRLEILTAYPNFGVTRRTDNGERCVVFHHGHFIESIYQLMSTLVSLVFPDQRGPESVYELEGENSAWIDFFWSALGSCERVGQNIERIYEASGDSTSLQRLTDTLARTLAVRYDLPLLEPNWTEEQVLKLLFRKKVVEKVAGKQERQKRLADETAVPLSSEAEKGLSWYLEGPLLSQMRVEYDGVPDLAAFVFGHTHKPFEAVMEVGGAQRPVAIFNTGGWVVDTVQPDRQHGAAVTVIDNELNCVNIHMYDERQYAVRVREPDEAGVHTPLCDQIADTIAAGTEWRAIGAAAAQAIALREENLKARRLRCGQE